MGGPRQPDPGTQPGCYRCSLPGLTGFTAGCRGGTDADHRYFISLGLGRAISLAMDGRRAEHAGATFGRPAARVRSRPRRFESAASS